MSSGQASVFSPSAVPVFDGTIVRGATRVRLPPGSGISEFPFQFSWPGLVNYIDSSPYIRTESTLRITGWAATMRTSASITMQLQKNGFGLGNFSFSTINSTGTFQSFFNVDPGDVISLAVISFGVGSARSMWIGLSAAAL